MSDPAIVDAITHLFIATDNRDWPRVERCFANEVTFDMTSMTGGTPSKTTPREIASGWETGLAPLDAVHHQIGNVLVHAHEHEAAVSCYGIAYHYRRAATNGRTRTFVGTYDFHLVRIGDEWKIDVFKFNLKFIDGNAELER